MSKFWILDEKGSPVRTDLFTWARWFGTNAKVISQERVGRYQVSTIFLGFDHRPLEFDSPGPPVLWESMIFENKLSSKTVMGRVIKYRKPVYQDRCAGSREQAEAMHASMIRRARALERRCRRIRSQKTT